MTYRRPLLLCFLIGCASPDYGPPDASTTIDLKESGGFAGPNNGRGVRIVGTTATYKAGTTTESATIATTDVAEIIHALEDIEFLDLDTDYTECTGAATDLPDVMIDVALAAGTKHVAHYLGCSGGVFDELKTLDQRIYDLSGFTAWAAAL